MYENVWRIGEMVDGDPETFRDLNNQEGRENIGLADEVVYWAFLNHPSKNKSWASGIVKDADGSPYVITLWGSDKYDHFTGSNKKSFASLDAAKKDVLKKIKSKTTVSHGYVMTKGSMSAKEHLGGNGTIDKRNLSWRQETGIADGLFVFRSPVRPARNSCPLNLDEDGKTIRERSNSLLERSSQVVK
jgi:hypothetical protein